MHLTIIAGSPRQGSISKRVALHLRSKLEAVPGVETGWVNMQEHALPPIQEVWKREEDVPASHRALFGMMHATDGFVVVSPEYNGGYSATMKNFMDHFTKQAYLRKPWGVVTSSTGSMGGMRASQQLLLLGAGLFAIPCPRMLVTPHADKKFDEDGRLLEASFETAIQTFMEEYLWLARKLVE